jgi:RNA polymerase sigma-70 factor, ECF subfamily
MVRYQRGDRNAFASLVRRHTRPVFNFILRQVGDFSIAEETTQEVFLRVVQKASHFKHEARFSTWLYTIARNLCIDHLRKQSLRRHPSLDQPLTRAESGRTLGDSIADPHYRSSVERNALSQQVGQCVIEAVELLPAEQKEVFLLREIANLPFKEIAQVTDAGENTVKSRMRYALQHLQQALSQFEEYARELK